MEKLRKGYSDNCTEGGVLINNGIYKHDDSFIKRICNTTFYGLWLYD